MDGYRNATTDFIKSAQGVVGAVDLLKTAVSTGDPADIDFASDLVQRAADDYAGSTTKHAQFGFDELAVATDQASPKQEQAQSDILVSCLLDIQVANTLIVTGQVAGESVAGASIEELDEVKGDLLALTNAVAFPLGKGMAGQAGATRFGFDEVPAAPPRLAAADLATAKANFESRVTTVLETLIEETRKVVQASFDGLTGLDGKKLTEALGAIGKAMKGIPTVGRLIGRGLRLLSQAFEKLTSLLGTQYAEPLREAAAEIVDRVKGGFAVLDSFLTDSYGVTGAKERVRVQLGATASAVAKIDEGTAKLGVLQTRFAEQMAIVTRIVKGLNGTKRLAGKVLPGAAADVLFAAFYLVAVGYALLAGKDFADSTALIAFVPGVITIADETLA